MKAAVLHIAGGIPQIQDFAAPPEGQRMRVLLAGLNPADVKLMDGKLIPVTLPRIVGREGIARTEDGRRVYFLDPAAPYGSWAEYVPDTARFIFPISDQIADDIAIAMGTSGTAGWLATRKAAIRPGDRVLVLGATGAVGRIAVQAARCFEAGYIIAAGRNKEALAAMKDIGAHGTVCIEGDEYAAALKQAAGEGFDVVIDAVYGDPLRQAIRTTTPGARVVTLGRIDASPMEIASHELLGRTLIGHSNSLETSEVLQDAMQCLATLYREGRMKVDVRRFPLESGPAIWARFSDGIHCKVVIEP